MRVGIIGQMSPAIMDTCCFCVEAQLSHKKEEKSQGSKLE